MQENTVILPLKDYNELRDIKEKVINDKMVISVDSKYHYYIFNYSNVDDTIKNLVKINEYNQSAYSENIEKIIKEKDLEIREIGQEKFKLNMEIIDLKKEIKFLKSNVRYDKPKPWYKNIF